MAVLCNIDNLPQENHRIKCFIRRMYRDKLFFYDFHYRVYRLVHSKNIDYFLGDLILTDCCTVLSIGCRASHILESCSCYCWPSVGKRM